MYQSLCQFFPDQVSEVSPNIWLRNLSDSVAVHAHLSHEASTLLYSIGINQITDIVTDDLPDLTVLCAPHCRCSECIFQCVP